MKKSFCIITSLIFILLAFSACSKADTSLWESNETFEDVVVYKYGDTISADFASSCNIKILDNNYKNFVKYIGDLKDAGFEYLQIGNIPENYNLSDGTASWRCTNGKIYLQLIFCNDGTEINNAFGCNVQIYGYSVMPESWGN